MSLKHSEIIDRIQANYQLSKHSIEKVLQLYFKIMLEELRHNGEFTIRGIGRISLVAEGGNTVTTTRKGKTYQRYKPYTIYPHMYWSSGFKNKILIGDNRDYGKIDIVKENLKKENKKRLEQEARDILLQNMFEQGKKGEKINGGLGSKYPIQTAQEKGLLKQYKKKENHKIKRNFINDLEEVKEKEQ